MPNWELAARRMLRVELTRQNVTYQALAVSLSKLGIRETQRSIANKLSRGTFSFIFFLQCMKALARQQVLLDIRDIDLE